METFSERIRALIGEGSANAFARECSIGESSVRQYLAGGVPGLDKVVQIARAKNVSIQWLATGEGPKLPAQFKEENFGTNNTSMATNFTPEGYVSIPQFDIRASAGAGIAITPADMEPTSAIAMRSSWLRSLGVSPAHAQFLVADGDSMLETIHDGDLLLVDRLIDRVINNAIYIVVLAGAVMVKRVQILFDGAILLISDNKNYSPERVEKPDVENLKVEGRVRWYGRAL